MLTIKMVINKLKPKKSDKVSRQYILYLIQTGRLPAFRYGREWLIKEEDFERFVKRYGYELRD